MRHRLAGKASMAGDGARAMVSVAGGMVSRGRLLGGGRFGKRIEQCKPGGRFARWRRRWSSAADCGATACSTTGALGCKTGSDRLGSDETAPTMWWLAASRRRTASAPVAARSARCCRRRSERRGCHRENRTAKQPQVASPPGAAPNPCKRSSRMAPFAGNRLASRAICRRCRSAGPKVFSARAAASAAPNSAGAGRIGPQDLLAVGRPQPCGQAARRVGRQSRIARAPAT